MDAQLDPQAWPSFTRMDPQQGARPFEWGELTSAQKDAACRLFGLLRGMLEAPHDPLAEGEGRAGFMPVIRERHANNVILIDGKRGSGKTSLMSTVLREMRQPFEGGGRRHLDFDQAGRLLPVTFLAMYPLPPSANLLLYLVGALEEVVCELETRPADGWRGPDAPPWTAATAQTLLSRDRWMDLYRAAANAWDGNLEQRAPNIDPEFYALELGQAERDRRHLSSIFRRFIDALCQDVTDAVHRRAGIWRQVDAGKDAGYRPFFVIVVDDADLSPERSVDLLGLLHKLNHPRVAFLLTGDSNLFLDLLRNHFLGMLLRPLAHLNLTTEGWQFEEEATRAVALAGATLERIVPPAHRCHVDDLKVGERLASLKDALRALAMPHANCWPENLYDYFEFERYASLALPGEIRTLNALQRTLADLTGPGSRSVAAGQSPYAAAIAGFVVELWSDLIEREPYIGRYRDELRLAVRMTEKQELVVDCGRLTSKVTARRVRVVPNGAWALDVMTNHTVVVSHPETGRVLSDPLKGIFKVAVDLVADFEAFQFAQGSPTPDGFQIEMMVVRWTCMQELGMKRGFTWPLPDWEEVLSFSLLAAAWREWVAMKVWKCANLDTLARAFLTLVLQVATDLRSVAHALADAPGGGGLAGGGGERSWDELARGVVECLPGSDATERDHRTAEWALGRAGLLAMPESGLPREVAGEWLRALQTAFESRGRWQEVEAAISGQRREHIRRRWDGEVPVTEAQIDGVLRAIDAASPGHPAPAAMQIATGAAPAGAELAGAAPAGAASAGAASAGAG